MSMICDDETRFAQNTLKHIDGIFRTTLGRKDRLLQTTVLADLKELAANLVELAAYLINQVKPLGSE